MANHLKMAMVETIVTLHRQGWSNRRIARQLGLDRGTVDRHIGRWEAAARASAADVGIAAGGFSNPTEVTLGSEGGFDSKPAEVTLGSEGAAGSVSAAGDASPTVGETAIPCAGTPPRCGRSRCECFRALIQEKLDAELSARRIHQDLAWEHGFTGSYQSVKRMVRRLEAGRPLPFRRIECDPGAEAQIDFGAGAPIVGPDGKRRRTHVFRMVLSHSRKGYSESVLRQTTDDLILCVENAFWSWGGVPRTLVIDNLKAAVIHADRYDPELNPKMSSFCRHYGTVLLPTKPAMPRHKGKVEGGIKYVRSNALKGRSFESLLSENKHLATWEEHVADLRIHGTIKRQVKQVFEEAERPALLPLPPERFANFHEAERIVHRDGHVEVDKAYYSAPPEYVGRTVWVRWNGRVVRIFNGRFEQIAIHAKQEMGRFRTDAKHIASEKISIVEKGATELLRRARRLGPQTGLWAENTLRTRGVEGMRTIVGLLAMARRHTSVEMERACGLASGHGVYRLRALRELLKEQVEQKQFAFIEEHPLIRNLNDYGTVVKVSFREGNPWEGPEEKGPEERNDPDDEWDGEDESNSNRSDGNNGNGGQIEDRSRNGTGPAFLSTTTTNCNGVASLPTNQSLNGNGPESNGKDSERDGGGDGRSKCSGSESEGHGEGMAPDDPKDDDEIAGPTRNGTAGERKGIGAPRERARSHEARGLLSREGGRDE